MNERQLKSFILAADLGSLSRAAAESYITTPAFVQQINLLENSLGFSLFLRNKRGVTLTESGKIFYDAAQQILHTYEDACKKCSLMEEEGMRQLRIGCPPEQFPAFVNQALKQFGNCHPDVRIDFVPSPLNRHLQDLRDGLIDLAFMAEPDEKALSGLVFLPLFEDCFCFCMKEDHPLAGRTLLRAGDLRGCSVLCGNYDYLKLPMDRVLPEEVAVCKLKSEYDSATQSRSMFSEDLIMIHSHWASCYSGGLTVVPSDIYAGSVGAVTRQPVTRVVNNFVACIETKAEKRS